MGWEYGGDAEADHSVSSLGLTSTCMVEQCMAGHDDWNREYLVRKKRQTK